MAASEGSSEFFVAGQGGCAMTDSGWIATACGIAATGLPGWIPLKARPQAPDERSSVTRQACGASALAAVRKIRDRRALDATVRPGYKAHR